MKKTIITTLKLIFFLGLGVFFIWIFVRQLTKEQMDEIFENMQKANYWWLLVSVLIGLIGHYARAARSKIFLEPLGYSPSVLNSFYAVMVGYLANLAIPRLGEVLRCTFLQRYEKIPFQKTFGTIIAERAIDMVVFVSLFFIAFALEFQRIHEYVDRNVFTPVSRKFGDAANNVFLYLLLFLGIIALVVWFRYRKKLKSSSFYRKIEQLVFDLWEGMASVTKVKKPGLFIFFTLLIWASYFFMTYVCFFAFDGLSGMPPIVAFTCLVFGTVAFMLVQGGIGLYPVIIAEVLVLYKVPQTLGYAAGWAGWSIQTLMILVFGTLSLILVAFNKTKNEDKTGIDQ